MTQEKNLNGRQNQFAMCFHQNSSPHWNNMYTSNGQKKKIFHTLARELRESNVLCNARTHTYTQLINLFALVKK